MEKQEHRDLKVILRYTASRGLLEQCSDTVQKKKMKQKENELRVQLSSQPLRSTYKAPGRSPGPKEEKNCKEWTAYCDGNKVVIG